MPLFQESIKLHQISILPLCLYIFGIGIYKKIYGSDFLISFYYDFY